MAPTRIERGAPRWPLAAGRVQCAGLLTGWARWLRAWALAGLLSLGTWGAAWAQDAALQPAPLWIYLSPGSQQYWQTRGFAFSLLKTRWERALLRSGGPGGLIEQPAQLAQLPSAGVLVLPMADVLDADERAAIARFVQAGGSVWASGALGARKTPTDAPDYSFLQALFDVRVHGHYAKTDDVFFVPIGDGALTWPVPAARRMGLVSLGESLLRLQGQHVAAWALDWARGYDPLPHDAMVFSEHGTSRRVLMAFPDFTWPDRPDAQRVIDASLAWLRHQPHAWVAAWPHGLQAAQLIEMDTEDKFASAVHLASQLEALDLRGTFYMLTSEAVQAPEVVADLLRRGHEIAYHADVHFGFKGDPESEQALRIAFMQRQLEPLLGARRSEATGFRAPTESYDLTTERLLRRYGLAHHAADESATDDRLPFFSNAEPGLPPSQALVVLPRTQLDDINFRGLRYGPAQVTQTLIRDLDETVRSGAFGLLSVHSQNYVDGGLMRLAMVDFLPHVAAYKDRLWVARGDAITRWWRERAGVRLQTSRLGEVLSLTLHSAQPVAGLTLMLSLPQPKASLQTRSAPAGLALRVKPLDDWRSALVLDALPAGQSIVQVKFGPPAP